MNRSLVLKKMILNLRMSKVLTLWSILFGSIFGEPGMYQTRSELSEMSCLAEWPNLIIRTTESIRNGAVFLDSVDIASPQVSNFIFFAGIKFENYIVCVKFQNFNRISNICNKKILHQT